MGFSVCDLTGVLCPAETVCMAAELKKEGITIVSQEPWLGADRHGQLHI